LPELLKKVAGFVPLDGPRFILTCRGGFAAICNGFGGASGNASFCSYLYAVISEREQMADAKYDVYLQAMCEMKLGRP
jgi:hypothetical protein